MTRDHVELPVRVQEYEPMPGGGDGDHEVDDARASVVRFFPQTMLQAK